MKPRITVSMSPDGLLEIFVNPTGRYMLVKELQLLDEHNDHFHLASDGPADIQLSTVAYRPTDRVITYGKVLFMTDEWDRQYYPHVLEDPH